MPDTGIYTGKGLAPNILQEGGKAMSRLSDFVMKAEEIKFNAFQKNKEWFLKQIDVDPAILISAGAQAAQTEALNVYKEAGKDILKRAGGDLSKLSTDDQTMLITAKNVLISKQNEMMAMQKMWEEEDALVKKNDVDFDETEHAAKTIEFATTGKFDYSSLPYRPLPIRDELMKIQGKIGATVPVTRPVKDNPGYLETIETTGTKEDIAPIIVDSVFRNPRIKKDMLLQWNNLSQVEKDKYLETDNKPGISEEERKAGETPTQSKENPILKFYIDQNYQYGIKEEPSGKPTRIPTPPANKNLGVTINIGGKNNVPVPVGIKRTVDVNYGGISRPNMYNLGGTTPLTDVPTTGGVMLEEGGLGAKTEGGNYAKAYLKDYDANRKTLIVQITTSDPISGTERLQLVEIPEKNITDYQNIHLMVDGKETTIGDLEGRQGTTAPATTTSGVNWK